MLLEDMFKEVDKRVSERIIGHVLPKALDTHINKEWKTCDCQYCSTKREASRNVGSATYTQEFLPKPSLKVNGIDPKTLEPILVKIEDFRELKDHLRDDLRRKYRQKLIALFSA